MTSYSVDAEMSMDRAAVMDVVVPEAKISCSAASTLALPEIASICTAFSEAAMETPLAAATTVLAPELSETSSLAASMTLSSSATRLTSPSVARASIPYPPSRRVAVADFISMSWPADKLMSLVPAVIAML